MITLIGNKVAISPLRDPGMSPGGLHIPDIAKEKCDQGIVKYVGPDVKDLKIGDYVLFGGYDGTLVLLEGEGTLIIMREVFVKCLIENVPDSNVPGLFFRAKPSKEAADKLENAMRKYTDYGDSTTGIFRNLTEEKILFCAIMDYIADQYFSATYEMAIELCSDHMSTQPLARELKAKNKINDRAPIDRPLEIEED